MSRVAATQGSLVRQTWALAAPVSAQFLLHSLRYAADVLMLGEVGDSQVAAVGLGTALHQLANAPVYALAGAVGIFASQFVGAGDRDGVRRAAHLGWIAGLLASLGAAAAFAAAPQPLMHWCTSDRAVEALGARYLRITAALPSCIAVVSVFGAVFNALGRPGVNAGITAVGVLVNVGLNWVLIFGAGPIPPLGVRGAAWATAVSGAVEVVLVAACVRWMTSPLRAAGSAGQGATRLPWSAFLRVALPLVAGGVLWHTGNFAYQVVFGHLGARALAAVTLLQPFRTVVFSLFWGVSSAAGVIVGRLLGARKYDAAFSTARKLIAAAGGIAAAAGVLLWAVSPVVFARLSGISAAVAADAHQVLLVMAVTIWILAINVVGIVGVLQSGADTRFVLIMDVICQWAVGVPAAALSAFALHAPLWVVYLAAFGEEIVKVFFWIPRFVSRRWQRTLVSPVAEGAPAQGRLPASQPTVD